VTAVTPQKRLILALLLASSLGGCGADGATGDPSVQNLQIEKEAEQTHVMPSACVDFTGHYRRDDADLLLTQEDCARLTWEELNGEAAYSHVFLADGSSRATQDEAEGAVRERTSINDGMLIERTSAAGAETVWVVYLSDRGCAEQASGTLQLTRDIYDASGEHLSCDAWSAVGEP
jgi:hypothetical protein